MGNAYTFDFVDGPYPCGAAPGVDLFYEAPYYSFYEPSSIAAIRLAHEWLQGYIEDNGPYDGVLMFSQGCALISALLLYHQAETPHLPFPFKVAIFICGGAPLDVIEDVGIHVSPEARRWDEASKVGLMQQASSEAILRLGAERWGKQAFDPAAPHDPSNIFGINCTLIPEAKLIPIPTVHIYGAHDPRYPASVTLAHLCNRLVSKVYDHGGGHDIPRKTEVSKKIAELVEWGTMMAQKA